MSCRQRLMEIRRGGLVQEGGVKASLSSPVIPNASDDRLTHRLPQDLTLLLKLEYMGYFDALITVHACPDLAESAHAHAPLAA